ncbi:MAG: hypothetical protein WBH68_07940 [Erysipelotrichaceae bacterium]|jgi:tetrahydromethanopterin S-methyltransferase subunit B|nr:hypothetical protein [Bacillota bacterium]NLP22359.1 hypothetical protein [Erysipelotrichaceae bacterium]HCY06971.1 hypothetical protein [Erysipelotrichaceae bacterium]
MSQYKYEEENISLNEDALVRALDEIYKDNESLDKQAKIKEDFNKTFDPSTPLEKVAPLIDEADKYTDMASLGTAGIFVNLAIFFLLIMFAQYNDFFSFIVVFGFVGFMIATIWLLAYASQKNKESQRELTNLRMTYFDKSILNKLFEEREKKSKVGGILLVASIFLGIFSLVLTAMTFLSDFALVPFFLFFAAGFFVSTRTASRKDTIKKLLDTLQN